MSSLLRFWLLLVVLLLSGCASPAPAEADEWGVAFQRSSGFGWTGGDAASSIPLPGGRILWLFGDSYLSDVDGGKRTNVQLRFGNTIAIERNVAPGVPPVAADLTFDWGAASSNGWLPIDPEMLRDPAAPRSGLRALELKLPVLSWPLHGTVVGTDLVLFDAVVTPFQCADCGAFPFKLHGSVASVVRGVDRPYEQWGFLSGEGWRKGHEPTQAFVPWSRAGVALDDVRGTLWGTFVMKDPSDPETLYVYGNRQTLDASELVVARVREVRRGDDVLDFGRWTFWDGHRWAPDVGAALGIAVDAAVEGSVVPVPASHGGGYALVQSGDLYGGEVRVSLSEQPWGPFAPRYTLLLADCPVQGFEPGAAQLTYAAKAHPELGTEDEMLVSLVTEHTSQGDATFIADTHEYAPRFVRLPWDEVLSYEQSSKERCGTVPPPSAR
jgi:hypothetical protein